MPQVLRRVNGGILTDQMLEGKLSFYEMTLAGLFANTISDGSIIIPNLPAFGGINTVGDGAPVPRSAAEIAFEVISTRATVVQIALLDDDTIQFALENETNGWRSASGVSVMQVGGGADDSGVLSVTITDSGYGYSDVPEVTFGAGDGAVPATASGTAVLDGNGVGSVTMMSDGSYDDATVTSVAFEHPIQVALRAIGSVVVPDNTSDGILVDFSNVVVVEKDFVLV